MGLEAGVSYIPTKSTKDNSSVDAFLARADAVYTFFPRKRIVPFLSVGGGALFTSGTQSTTSPLIAYGAGLKYFLKEYLALRLDLRHNLLYDQGLKSDYQYTAGVSMSLFRDKKLKRLPVVDSDGDGVPDELDLCPATPKGVKIDKNGCPLDTDGDGVADYLDKCPDTPRGVAVAKNGCPLEQLPPIPPAIQKERERLKEIEEKKEQERQKQLEEQKRLERQREMEELQGEPKPETKPATKPEQKPETKPEQQPETKPEGKPEAKGAPQPASKAAAQPESKAAAGPATPPAAAPPAPGSAPTAAAAGAPAAAQKVNGKGTAKEEPKAKPKLKMKPKEEWKSALKTEPKVEPRPEQRQAQPAPVPAVEPQVKAAPMAPPAVAGAPFAATTTATTTAIPYAATTTARTAAKKPAAAPLRPATTPAQPAPKAQPQKPAKAPAQPAAKAPVQQPTAAQPQAAAKAPETAAEKPSKMYREMRRELTVPSESERAKELLAPAHPAAAEPPHVAPPAPAAPSAQQKGRKVTPQDKCPDTPLEELVQRAPADITATVLFKTNSAEVSPRYLARLEEIAQFAREHRGVPIYIEGHADNHGSPAYNLQLSIRRVKSIKEILVNRFKLSGIKMALVGKGCTIPIDDNRNDGGRANNRRVVIEMRQQ